MNKQGKIILSTLLALGLSQTALAESPKKHRHVKRASKILHQKHSVRRSSASQLNFGSQSGSNLGGNWEYKLVIDISEIYQLYKYNAYGQEQIQRQEPALTFLSADSKILFVGFVENGTPDERVRLNISQGYLINIATGDSVKLPYGVFPIQSGSGFRGLAELQSDGAGNSYFYTLGGQLVKVSPDLSLDLDLVPREDKITSFVVADDGTIAFEAEERNNDSNRYSGVRASTGEIYYVDGLDGYFKGLDGKLYVEGTNYPGGIFRIEISAQGVLNLVRVGDFSPYFIVDYNSQLFNLGNRIIAVGFASNMAVVWELDNPTGTPHRIEVPELSSITSVKRIGDTLRLKGRQAGGFNLITVDLN